MQHLEGRLRILRVELAADAHSAEHIVIFIPDSARSGLPHQRCRGEGHPMRLLRDTGISESEVEIAVHTLRRKPMYEVPHILLTPDQLEEFTQSMVTFSTGRLSLAPSGSNISG